MTDIKFVKVVEATSPEKLEKAINEAISKQQKGYSAFSITYQHNIYNLVHWYSAIILFT